MHNLKSKLEKLKKHIKKEANLRKVRLAKLIAFNLINTTPVDTSKALSNWIVNIQSPSKKEIPPYFVGVDGSTADMSAAASYLMAETKIRRAKVGQTIYITNNVDYILLLNMGLSRQAQPHFIEEQISNAIENEKRTKL